MKIKDLMLALSQCDPETEIKIAHIDGGYHKYNTEIDSQNTIITANAPDGNGEEYLIRTNYGKTE